MSSIMPPLEIMPIRQWCQRIRLVRNVQSIRSNWCCLILINFVAYVSLSHIIEKWWYGHHLHGNQFTWPKKFYGILKANLKGSFTVTSESVQDFKLGCRFWTKIFQQKKACRGVTSDYNRLPELPFASGNQRRSWQQLDNRGQRGS